MDRSQRDVVIRLAVETGVSKDLFEGWDGTELALYTDRGGASASLEIAQAIAAEKAARRDWVLDLGNRAFALPEAQGLGLQAKLDQGGIPYESGPQGVPYLKRTRWAINEHRDVLDELAKR